MTSEQKFKYESEYRIHRLKHFAKKYKWTLLEDNGDAFKFTNKDLAILKINYWTLSIETSLSHPEWGNTVLLRKGDLTQKVIQSIFRNPRQHMSKKIKSEYL